MRLLPPSARCSGDSHFAPRGSYRRYMGPSEVFPALIVLDLPTCRELLLATVHVYEECLPGIPGAKHNWRPSLELIKSESIVEHTAAGPSCSDDLRLLTLSHPTISHTTSDMPEPNSALSNEHTTGPQYPSVASPDPSPAAPEPATQPSTQPWLVSLDPDLPTDDLPHPQADNPASRHFVRNHPQRARRPPIPLLIDKSSGQTYARVAATYGPSIASLMPNFQVASADRLTHIAAFSARIHTPVHDPASMFAYEDCLSPIPMPDNGSLPLMAFAASAPPVMTSDLGSIDVPKSYRQAVSGAHSEYWKEAINNELAGLISMNTWAFVPKQSLPSHANIINCHFVFALKRRADGSIDKFKARLVADGNTQRHGVDFDRVFSTVVKTVTIRLVLALAAAADYNLSSIDVRQAYLQATLDPRHRIFMRVPPGVICPPDSVCLLRRSLYGLKQAGREWSILFASFLVTWGFKRSTIDPCMYTYADKSDKTGSSSTNDTVAILWVLIYVDDVIIADNDTQLRNRFVQDLSARFPVEDKGPLTLLL